MIKEIHPINHLLMTTDGDASDVDGPVISLSVSTNDAHIC